MTVRDKRQPPCKGCEERRPLCHSGCEAYKAWASALRAAKDATIKSAHIEARELLIAGAYKAMRSDPRKTAAIKRGRGGKR